MDMVLMDVEVMVTEECITTITTNTRIVTQQVQGQTTEEEQVQPVPQQILKQAAIEPQVLAITALQTPEQTITDQIIRAVIQAADGGTVQGHPTQDQVALAEGVRVHQAATQTPAQEGVNNNNISPK